MDGGDIEDNEDEPSSMLEVVEEESSQQMNSKKPDLVDTNELELFRKQWREELSLRRVEKPDQPREQLQGEEEATRLYWMGAAAEKSGDMHAAILYYRQAVQLVPDIEFRVIGDEPQVTSDDDDEGSDECGESNSSIRDCDAESELLENFCSLSVGLCCQPERPTTGTHISSLPVDVIRYILRWVVSSQLEMRSLEQVSLICRGFYCLAREPQLWRMACRKLWKDCDGLSVYGGSWRRMFILKPHLHFNGVYICSASYVRRGERSLDGLYKPYHTVVYYRYLRFFPDGSVMYQTSPVEPAQTVSKLCHKHSTDSVLLGEYCLQGNKVIVDVLSYQNHTPNIHYKGRGGRGKKIESTHEQRFHMEFILESSNKRRYNQLTWNEFYCHSLHRPTGHVQISHFTLDYMYAPFYFSRVRSFTTNSTGLLT